MEFHENRRHVMKTNEMFQISMKSHEIQRNFVKVNEHSMKHTWNVLKISDMSWNLMQIHEISLTFNGISLSVHENHWNFNRKPIDYKEKSMDNHRKTNWNQWNEQGKPMKEQRNKIMISKKEECGRNKEFILRSGTSSLISWINK